MSWRCQLMIACAVGRSTCPAAGAAGCSAGTTTLGAVGTTAASFSSGSRDAGHAGGRPGLLRLPGLLQNRGGSATDRGVAARGAPIGREADQHAAPSAPVDYSPNGRTKEGRQKQRGGECADTVVYAGLWCLVSTCRIPQPDSACRARQGVGGDRGLASRTTGYAVIGGAGTWIGCRTAPPCSWAGRAQRRAMT
jgi:hypothetical protein